MGVRRTAPGARRTTSDAGTPGGEQVKVSQVYPQRKRPAAYVRLDGNRSGRVMAPMKQVEAATADAATAPTERETR